MKPPYVPMLEVDTIVDVGYSLRRSGGYFMVTSIIGSHYEFRRCTKSGNRFFKYLMEHECEVVDRLIVDGDNLLHVMEEETNEYRLNKRLQSL